MPKAVMLPNVSPNLLKLTVISLTTPDANSNRAVPNNPWASAKTPPAASIATVALASASTNKPAGVISNNPSVER